MGGEPGGKGENGPLRSFVVGSVMMIPDVASLDPLSQSCRNHISFIIIIINYLFLVVSSLLRVDFLWLR